MLLVVALGCTEDSSSPAGECALPPASGEDGRVVGFTEAHNEVRRDKGVADLTWDPDLVSPAAEWLAHLVAERGCELEHDLSSPLGENLGWNEGFENNACHIVDEWASEEADWDYGTASCTGSCGHWTQLVWSSTERLGCAMDVCLDGAEIWMCVYDPPGNVPGVPPF